MSFLKDAWNGIIGKTAAQASEKAGQMQADASKYAADISQKQFERTREDQMPWLEAGKKALGELQDYVGRNKSYDDVWGRRYDQAYQNGQLTGGMSLADFQADPSYQWRKQQGMDGIQAQAAAGGGLLSGATLKALNEYNSNLASQEYANAYARHDNEQNQLANVLNNGRTQDYSLFNNEDTRQYNQLANLAGVGQQTATTLGTFGAQNAANIGNAYTNAANARANGVVGAANARQQGMGNLFNLGVRVAGMFI